MELLDNNLPDAAIELLKYLQVVGSASQKEILGKLNLPLRTIRYSIRRLKEEQLITSKPDLLDMRSLKYEINQLFIDKIEQVITLHQESTA